MPSEYQDLMRQFAAHVGLTNAEIFLEHELLIVDELPVHFSEQLGETGAEIWYFSPLGQMPSPARPEHYVTLLESNDFWIETGGATISLQKGTGQARLSGRQALAVATVTTLASGVGRLAHSAIQYQKMIKDMGSDTAGPVTYEPHVPNLA